MVAAIKIVCRTVGTQTKPQRKGWCEMSDGSLLLTLQQINICLGLYESEKLAVSEMTFAQAFLLNEIFDLSGWDKSANISVFCWIS